MESLKKLEQLEALAQKQMAFNRTLAAVLADLDENDRRLSEMMLSLFGNVAKALEDLGRR